jgi:hypothetical protein
LELLGYIDRDRESEVTIAYEIATKVLLGRFSKMNIFIFLCHLERLIGFTIYYAVYTDDESAAASGKDSYGTFTLDGDFRASEVESRRIQKRYELIRVKRQNYLKSMKQAKSSQYIITNTLEF